MLQTEEIVHGEDKQAVEEGTNEETFYDQKDVDEIDIEAKDPLAHYWRDEGQNDAG